MDKQKSLDGAGIVITLKRWVLKRP